LRRASGDGYGSHDCLERRSPAIAPDRVLPADIDVWPDGQSINPLESDSAIAIAHFKDHAAYHPPLIARMLELERNPAFVDRLMRGSCGVKVRHVDKWDCAAADLIHARAQELFRRMLKTGEAVVDDCWGNIYRRNDYCMPHSHMRATASVVYFLESGEAEEPGDRLAGKFFIADPRLKYCTPYLDGHMTRVLVPNAQRGSMIIFPGYILHGVNPYLGEKPRLTLSWNINQRAIEGTAAGAFRETTGKPR